MTDKAEVNIDDLAAVIRDVDGNHKLGAGALAEEILSSPTIASLTDEVERSRMSEIDFFKHGLYLTTALKAISDLVKENPDSEISKKIDTILEKMWSGIVEQSPGAAESLWGTLTRDEQEEYRDIHYSPGTEGEPRSREIENLARERLAGTE